MKSPNQQPPKQTVEELLLRQPTSFRTWHFPEPLLELGGSGKSADPKAGITLHGPWGNQDDQNILSIRVGIIGTGDTISDAQHWLNRCRTAVHPSKSDVDPILFPTFPGMEGNSGFNCQLEFPTRLQEALTAGEVARCTAAASRDAAVDAITEIIGQRLEALAEKDSPPDVVIVALTDEIREAAGGGRGPIKAPKKKKIPSQLSFFDLPPPTQQQDTKQSKTLHRAIKAEGMRVGLRTQLAWPAAFKGTEGVQDDATRAWNFCTALYYKAGGVPWRVSGLAKNTCYIGITFFRPAGNASLLQTSMAQAFSDRGDGIVLRGESFEWDPRTQGEPHLSKESAKTLIYGVIEQYAKHLRQPPTRVVVHKSSGFSEDEIAGMEEALKDIPHHDFLSIGRSRIRFLRPGAEPPVRGTAIEVAPKHYVFYTGGYVPFLKVYPGLRIPSPLSIVHYRGTGSVSDVLGEILSLTKLNWNSAAFATAAPITIDFSNSVGLILSELPPEIEPRNLRSYYM